MPSTFMTLFKSMIIKPEEPPAVHQPPGASMVAMFVQEECTSGDRGWGVNENDELQSNIISDLANISSDLAGALA